MYKLNFSDLTSVSSNLRVGLSQSTLTGSDIHIGVDFGLASGMRIKNGVSVVWSVIPATGQVTNFAFICNGSSGGFLINADTGELFYVYDNNGTSNVYAKIWMGVTALNATVDYMKVAQLGGNWATADGIALVNEASPSAGTDYTIEKDFFLSCVVDTLPTTERIRFQFRKQDADNYLEVSIDSAGTVRVDEIVATVRTLIFAQGATVSAGERFCFRIHNNAMDIFDANIRRNGSTSALTFTSGNDAELNNLGGGTISDLKIYPSALSGNDLSEIQKF
jgi:hypothetical protein